MEAVGGGSIVAFTQEEMKWLERSSSGTSSDEDSTWLPPTTLPPTPAAAAAALGTASDEVGRASFDTAAAGGALVFFSAGRDAAGLAGFAEAAGAEGALAAPAINFDCAEACALAGAIVPLPASGFLAASDFDSLHFSRSSSSSLPVW